MYDCATEGALTRQIHFEFVLNVPFLEKHFYDVNLR